MDPELRRRATRSEQRQHDDEKHPPRYCAFSDCTVEVAGLYCEDHDLAALCSDPECIADADDKAGKYCARHEAEYANAYAEMVADAMHFERAISDDYYGGGR